LFSLLTFTPAGDIYYSGDLIVSYQVDLVIEVDSGTAMTGDKEDFVADFVIVAGQGNCDLFFAEFHFGIGMTCEQGIALIRTNAFKPGIDDYTIFLHANHIGENKEGVLEIQM